MPAAWEPSCRSAWHLLVVVLAVAVCVLSLRRSWRRAGTAALVTAIVVIAYADALGESVSQHARTLSIGD